MGNHLRNAFVLWSVVVSAATLDIVADDDAVREAPLEERSLEPVALQNVMRFSMHHEKGATLESVLLSLEDQHMLIDTRPSDYSWLTAKAPLSSGGMSYWETMRYLSKHFGRPISRLRDGYTLRTDFLGCNMTNAFVCPHLLLHAEVIDEDQALGHRIFVTVFPTPLAIGSEVTLSDLNVSDGLDAIAMSSWKNVSNPRYSRRAWMANVQEEYVETSSTLRVTGRIRCMVAIEAIKVSLNCPGEIALDGWGIVTGGAIQTGGEVSVVDKRIGEQSYKYSPDARVSKIVVRGDDEYVLTGGRSGPARTK